MSDNWVVQNLENALDTWNEKLAEIWTLLTQSPQDFKGGGIWNVIVNINGAVQAIGLALLVLFFVVGMVKTCSSFAEVKKPEHALKLFVRFALAKGLVTYGMELMLALFEIVQGIISTIMNSAGIGSNTQTTLPNEMITAIESCGFFESIPLWAVTLIGSLFVTVLSFILILTVYGRFFKLYMFTALAPIPLSTFAGEPTQNVGRSFIKAYCGVLLEGAVYKIFHRVSCWCCPLQSLDELRKLRKCFPELWKQLELWDKNTWRTFKPGYSVQALNVRFDFEEEWQTKGEKLYTKKFYIALRERLKEVC